MLKPRTFGGARVDCLLERCLEFRERVLRSLVRGMMALLVVLAVSAPAA